MATYKKYLGQYKGKRVFGSTKEEVIREGGGTPLSWKGYTGSAWQGISSPTKTPTPSPVSAKLKTTSAPTSAWTQFQQQHSGRDWSKHTAISGSQYQTPEQRAGWENIQAVGGTLYGAKKISPVQPTTPTQPTQPIRPTPPVFQLPTGYEKISGALYSTAEAQRSAYSNIQADPTGSFLYGQKKTTQAPTAPPTTPTPTPTPTPTQPAPTQPAEMPQNLVNKLQQAFGRNPSRTDIENWKYNPQVFESQLDTAINKGIAPPIPTTPAETPTTEIPFKEGLTPKQKTGITNLVQSNRKFNDTDAQNYAYSIGESNWQQFVDKTGSEVMALKSTVPTGEKEIAEGKTDQTIGLNAAWARYEAGTSNETDDANLKYAQENGLWSPPTSEQQEATSIIDKIKSGELKNADITPEDLAWSGVDPKELAPIFEAAEGIAPWSEQASEIEEKFAEDKIKIEAEMETAENDLITQFQSSETLTNTFNGFYTDAGMEGVQGEITSYDDQINTAKSSRDAELRDVSGKVIPQWMITGEKQLAIQRWTDEINNLVNVRNTKAKEYNTKWDEIMVKVGLSEKDTAQKADNLQSILDVYSGKQDKVNAKIVEALQRGGIKYEEDQQRLLAQITAGMIPTKASIAKELALAKVSGESRVIGDSTIGYYQYDPNTGTVSQLIGGMGWKSSATKVIKPTKIEKVNTFESILIDNAAQNPDKKVNSKAYGDILNTWINNSIGTRKSFYQNFPPRQFLNRKYSSNDVYFNKARDFEFGFI